MRGTRRITGCLFGLAIGDSLAAPTEFLSIGEIVERFGPHGPRKPSSKVTDDTQMAIAVGEALLRAPQPYAAETLEPCLREAFVEWLNSPDNDRAPGTTCIKACEALQAGRDWQDSSVLGSKGCGANMRVAAVGLLPHGLHGFTERTRGAIAQLQAAMTHGHPTALAAADLTAAAIAELVQGCEPAELIELLQDYAQAQRRVYHLDWLGELWRLQNARSAEEFIEQGWDDCLASLERVEKALVSIRPNQDPCEETGEGWVAEEALATALLCFLLSPDNAVTAVRRAAVTCGDSDSIAAITGALAGARLGIDAWPAEWVDAIEYRDRLLRLANSWERDDPLPASDAGDTELSDPFQGEIFNAP